MAESNIEGDLHKNQSSTPMMEAEHIPRKSVIRRIWNSFSILGHLFYKTSKEDFEKRLQHLSKEEAAAHTRLKRRAQTWRKLARGAIIYSIIIELLILGIAVIATRAPELSWQMRALRVLPAFLFPALASLMYSSCASYYRMRERKDQKTLDRLRNERQAKIDELKERTNYYLTQQLIHKYDSDPAAKEAAARVLASKLGADAGLKLSMDPFSGDESKLPSVEAKSQDSETVDSTGLRRRTKHQNTTSISQGQFSDGQVITEATTGTGSIGPWEHGMGSEQRSGKAGSGGWVGRLAAMLVGEDPTQCYALICWNCHMHNGLARKEDYQYITYFCPHCHSLNGSRQLGERGEGSSSLEGSPSDVAFEHPKHTVLLRNAPNTPRASVETGSLAINTRMPDTIDDPKID